MITRRFAVAAFLCCLTLVSGKHAGRSHERKSHENRKPVGKDDLIDGDIDYDHVSPKDCASYLCASDVDLATDYIEEGCPGPFARYGIEDEGEMMHEDMQGFTASEPIFEQSGVSTGTLLGLAGACGVFSAGVGFMAGYKASPTFAYMRIPSLV